MARKKIHTAVSASTGYKEAKVYRDAENDEYRVCFYIDGKKIHEADYHTSDKNDALHTANFWVK